MKPIIVVLAGGLLVYGIYLYRKDMKKKTAAMVPQGGKQEPALTITETTEEIPAYLGMLERYDSNMENIFAPPKTYVVFPDAVGGQNIINRP